MWATAHKAQGIKMGKDAPTSILGEDVLARNTVPRLLCGTAVTQIIWCGCPWLIHALKLPVTATNSEQTQPAA